MREDSIPREGWLAASVMDGWVGGVGIQNFKCRWLATLRPRGSLGISFKRKQSSLGARSLLSRFHRAGPSSSDAMTRIRRVKVNSPNSPPPPGGLLLAFLMGRTNDTLPLSFYGPLDSLASAIPSGLRVHLLKCR